jgi:hypothetical protein
MIVHTFQQRLVSRSLFFFFSAVVALNDGPSLVLRYR